MDISSGTLLAIAFMLFMYGAVTSREERRRARAEQDAAERRWAAQETPEDRALTRQIARENAVAFAEAEAAFHRAQQQGRWSQQADLETLRPRPDAPFWDWYLPIYLHKLDEATLAANPHYNLFAPRTPSAVETPAPDSPAPNAHS